MIPARGGSKGVPRKALRRIAGESLIARCVRTCKAAALVNRVYISTEDREIAEAAGAAGAFWIDRPQELATDTATSLDVFLHACGELASDLLALVQCTAPLLTSAELDGAIRLAIDSAADCVALVAESDHWQCREDFQHLIPVGWSFETQTRRQDRRPTYCLDGSAWIVPYQDFVRREAIYGARNLVYKVQRRQLDIDTEEDLRWAKAIIEREKDLTEAGPIE